MLSHWVSPNSGIYWGNFDCHRHGWELDWDEPAQLDVCAGDTPQCTKIFKSCLLMSHPASAPPTPEDCWCYHDAVELGCPALCADEIFQSYGRLSLRCHGFSVYHECLRFFAGRDNATQSALLPEEGGEEAVVAEEQPPVATEQVFEPVQLVRVEPGLGGRYFIQRPATVGHVPETELQQLVVDPDAAAAGEVPDAGPDAEEEEADEEEEGVDPDAEADEEEGAGGEEDLQFRQPAGTYVQADQSAKLIEPWQFQSPGIYEPREDELPVDDDDPRE